MKKNLLYTHTGRRTPTHAEIKFVQRTLLAMYHVPVFTREEIIIQKMLRVDANL